MSKVSYINRHNLRVTRENVGLEAASVSRSISSSEKDIVKSWEDGEELPTWVQVKKLATKYNVAELVFSSKTNIQAHREILDFRVGIPDEEKNSVKKLIHLVFKRQTVLERILKDDGYKKNTLIGLGKTFDTPKQLADFIAEKLDIDFEDIKTIEGSDANKKVLRYIIQKAEKKRIFVGKTISYHKISVTNMRGLFIANDYCPFIILNRQDAISAQIFSLIHELAHLFRKTESISNSVDFVDVSNGLQNEEVFCNKVAANLLLPVNEFPKDEYGETDIQVLAERYKSSKLFVFYRLKELKKIDTNELSQLETKLKKESADGVLEKTKRRQKTKGGNYYNSMKDSNGSLYNKIVASFYFEKKLNYVEASNLLNFSVERV